MAEVTFANAKLAKALFDVSAAALHYLSPSHRMECDEAAQTVHYKAFDEPWKAGVEFKISQAAGELVSVVVSGGGISSVNVAPSGYLPFLKDAASEPQSDPKVKFSFLPGYALTGDVEYQRFAGYDTKGSISASVSGDIDLRPVEGQLTFRVSPSTMLRLFTHLAYVAESSALGSIPIEIERSGGKVNFKVDDGLGNTTSIGLVEGDTQGCDIIQDLGYTPEKFENVFANLTPIHDLVEEMHLEDAIFEVNTYQPLPSVMYTRMYITANFTDESYVRYTINSIFHDPP
eukprot:m.85139 g.85139  ORF g.85139 m.85139 type:complete len:288 (+) comp14711_c2_seq1:508-1371(+)